MKKLNVRFCSDLFTDEPIDAFFKQRCLESVEKSLSPPQRALCEGSLSLDELTNSVKSLNTGKSPESNGLSVEFYLHFWETLGPLLLRVSNQCFSDGELCGSMKGSVTRLIFKKRGDIKHLKNWRPISLLNVDYKIFLMQSLLVFPKFLNILSTLIRLAPFLAEVFFLMLLFCLMFWTTFNGRMNPQS